MDKRIEARKQRNKALKEKMKNAMAIFFCIMLLISSVYIADMSIRELIMCNDEKYALAVSLQEGNILRLDIAGERFMFNVEPAVRAADYVVNFFKCQARRLDGY